MARLQQGTHGAAVVLDPDKVPPAGAAYGEGGESGREDQAGADGRAPVPAGRAGHSHGVVQAAEPLDADRQVGQRTGPAQARAQQSRGDQRDPGSSPARSRSRAGAPRAKWPPTAPRASAPHAAPAMMTAPPKRSQGSHDPDTRSGSPSGLCVVALITAAAAAAMISGNMTEYTPLAGVQRSATRSPTATPARASRLAGRARRTRCRPAKPPSWSSHHHPERVVREPLPFDCAGARTGSPEQADTVTARRGSRPLPSPRRPERRHRAAGRAPRGRIRPRSRATGARGAASDGRHRASRRRSPRRPRGRSTKAQVSGGPAMLSAVPWASSTAPAGRTRPAGSPGAPRAPARRPRTRRVTGGADRGARPHGVPDQHDRDSAELRGERVEHVVQVADRTGPRAVPAADTETGRRTRAPLPRTACRIAAATGIIRRTAGCSAKVGSVLDAWPPCATSTTPLGPAAPARHLPSSGPAWLG